LGERFRLGVGEWKGEPALDGVLLRWGDGDAAAFLMTDGDGGFGVKRPAATAIRPGDRGGS